MNPISLPAYAVPTKVSRIALANRPEINAVVNALQREVDDTESHLHRFLFVSRGQAALEVDISEGDIVFNNVNPRLHALGYSRMPYRVNKGENKIIRSILQAAGDFDSFLNLNPANRSLCDFIRVEFVRITRPADWHHEPAVQHGVGHNLAMGNLVEISAGSALYGMKITNNHPSLQLYPHLFLFDCSDLSIGMYPPMCLQYTVTHSFFRNFL
jgi:hypothetical protein